MSQLGPGAVCPRPPYLWMSVGDIKTETCCCCCCSTTAHFLQSSLPLQPPQVLAWDSPPTAPLGLPVSRCSLPLLRGLLPPSLRSSLRLFSPARLTRRRRLPPASLPPHHTTPPKKPSTHLKTMKKFAGIQSAFCVNSIRVSSKSDSAS